MTNKLLTAPYAFMYFNPLPLGPYPAPYAII